MLLETISGSLKSILNFNPFSVNSVQTQLNAELSFLLLPLSPFFSFCFYWSPPVSAGSSPPPPSAGVYFTFKMSLPGSYPFPKTTAGAEKSSSNSPVYDTLPALAKNLGGGTFGGGSNFLAALCYLASFASCASVSLVASILF